jgi:hypothetical protein
MVLTVLEATIAPERVADLQAAFQAAAAGPLPAGLIRSHLVCASADGTSWRIESLWTNRGALDAMRTAALSVFDVAATIEAPRA